MRSLQLPLHFQQPSLRVKPAASTEQKSEPILSALLGRITMHPDSWLNNHNVCLARKENKALQNRKVTDYFPIRRSNRKTKTEIKVCIKKYIGMAFIERWKAIIFMFVVLSKTFIWLSEWRTQTHWWPLKEWDWRRNGGRVTFLFNQIPYTHPIIGTNITLFK